jgi:excinuclease UvrABC helicase subunit UvrB
LLLNKISSFFPSFSNIKQHTHTHTHTTRQVQEDYDQANQSHPKTLDTNPSQKQIPTAIGEKQKKNKQKTKKQENPASNPLQILFNKNTQTKAPFPFVSLKTPHIHTTVEHV